MNINLNKNIRIFSLLFLMMMFVAVAYASDDEFKTAAPANIEIAELEAFLDSLIQAKMEEHHIPGVQFIMVKDGGICFAKGYGFADLENEIPVTPDRTLFRICSIAKVVTATAVMQLVEQGKIDLNKDVNEYLTMFKINNPFPQPVTMRHLLTHTAGFDDVYLDKVGRTPDEQMPLGEFLAKKLPPVITPPGEVCTYSNLGNALAGYLIEVVSGQDFAEYTAENIFEPLEMTHSSFRLPDSLAPDLVKGYFYKNSGYIHIPFDFLNDYPAGQMISTAADMAKFMIAHLQQGRYKDRQILNESTVNAMHSKQFSHHPKLDDNYGGFAFGVGSIRGQKLSAHDGGYLDAATRLWLFPESDIGIYMACNTMNSRLNNDVTHQLAERLFPAVEKDTTKYPLENLPEYDANVDRFVGTYRFTRYSHGSITKAGVLTGAIAPEMPIWRNEQGMILMNDLFGKPRRMIQIEPLLFQSIDDDYYCAFREDENGEITYLFTNGTNAFEKVEWYHTVPFQQKFFIACFIILFAATTGIGGRFLIRKIKKQKPDASTLEKRVRTFAWITSFTLLFYLLAFGIMVLFIPQKEIMIGFGNGFPGIISIIQVIPFLGIVSMLFYLFYLMKSWFQSDIGISAKIVYSIVLLAGIGYLWFLNYWNMVGWRLS